MMEFSITSSEADQIVQTILYQIHQVSSDHFTESDIKDWLNHYMIEHPEITAQEFLNPNEDWWNVFFAYHYKKKHEITQRKSKRD